MRGNEDTRKSSERPEESVEHQHKDSVGVGDVGHGDNPGVSDRHLKKLDESNDVECIEERNYVNAGKTRDEGKVNTDDEGETKGNSGMKESGGERRAEHGHLKKQDESNDAQRRERDTTTDKTGRDEQSEQRGTSLTKNLYMDTEHHENEGLRNVKHDNLEGQEKMWHVYGPSVDQQGDVSRTETDVEVDKKGKTDPSPQIEDRRVDGQKQYMSEECQGLEARRIREDRRDVEGAKEQKRGDDKHAQRTDTSMTKPYLCKGGEDQDKRGLDGVGQQKTSVPHLTPKDVDEERPADAQRRERDAKKTRLEEMNSQNRGAHP
ncbi:hypothetical protein KUDE01_014680 [Dissostichus eleginoides]|uniref:Uncharacterized protein n=1 Tax=Dissostichus eleginoides TaxID=100907 RepID=A0AAD9BT96_DISEL|nr:hypothetical protein KUDE01_014680 [Dissostichus eleginoides]